MKKIFSYIALFFIICFAGFSSVSAVTIPVGSNNIINQNSGKIPYCANSGDCSLDKGIEEAKGKVDSIESEGTATEFIQRVVSYILGFLLFVTVLIIIGAGFMILTAAGNDERVETAKKVIKNGIIGLIVIFLAYPISEFVIGAFTKAKTNATISTKP